MIPKSLLMGDVVTPAVKVKKTKAKNAKVNGTESLTNKINSLPNTPDLKLENKSVVDSLCAPLENGSVAKTKTIGDMTLYPGIHVVKLLSSSQASIDVKRSRYGWLDVVRP